MAYSPAAVQAPSTPAHETWTTAAEALLLFAAVALLGLFVGRTLDDRQPSSGATTARTSLGVIPALGGSDLGGVINHRGGNQP